MALENLPANPGELVSKWLDDAKQLSGQVNWNVMMLATTNAQGKPAVRAVLLKSHDAELCTFTFYTNYQSRKAREMAANGRIACVMYWDTLERQIRIEGAVTKVSAEESDAYFATRPRESKIGAWASQQSEPIESHEALLKKAQQVEAQYAGRDIPRPPHWGGYCITADTIEFWHGKPGRIHERVAYARPQPSPSVWTQQWLNP